MRTSVDWILIRAVEFRRAIQSRFRSGATGRRGGGRSIGRRCVAGADEDVRPRVAQIAIGIVIQTGRTILLKRFHVGANVEKLRTPAFRIHIIAVLQMQAIEIDGRENRRRASCCLECRGRMQTAAIEYVQPQIAFFIVGVVIKIGRTQVSKTDTVSAEVEFPTTLGQWIAINTVADVGAGHGRRRSGTDIGDRSCYRTSCWRSRCTGTNESIGWNIARLRIRIEDQTGRAIQLSRLTAVATEKRVRAIRCVITVGVTGTIEIYVWQRHRRRIRKSSFVDVFTGTGENAILPFARFPFAVVEETVRTRELNRFASDAHEISIAAKRFHCADRIRIIAFGFVLAIDDRCGCRKGLIAWRLSRRCRRSRFSATGRNVNPRFAHF